MNNSEKRRFTLLAVLALIALGVSAYLTQHYYEVRGGVAGFKSLCNIGSAMNCDVVAASSYAELFLGIPLSSAAGGWYLGLFIVALFGRNLYWRREATRAAFVMTAVSAAGSVFYTLIMAFVIKTFCLFCLIAHGLDLVMFGIVLSLRPEGFGEHKADLSRWKTFGISVAISLVVVVLAFQAFNPVQLDRGRMASMADTILGTAPISINNRPEMTGFGNPSAPIVITEFVDLQCPSCRLGAQTMNSLVNRFPEQVRVVMRNYPLDSACNPAMQPGHGHSASCEAAKAVQCAARQGQFKPAYQDLFENQTLLGPTIPTARVKALAGIDATKLDACIQSGEIAALVAEDIREGTTLGVQSTPTFFFNGRKVEGALPLPVWERAVEETLKSPQK